MTCRAVAFLSVAWLASAGGAVSAQPWSPEMHNARIAWHATANDIPQTLVRRVIKIESGGNPTLVSKGNYGLMQIRLGTAKSMGYQGDAEGLLDPDVNMTYAVKYLAGAYRAADNSEDGAIRNYQRGYYASAKAKGFSPYEKPPMVAAAPAPVMPPAPLSAIAAFMTPAQTPAEIVRARMPRAQPPAAELMETKPALDTRPRLTPATTAMAPSESRPLEPKPVKVERRVAAKPEAVKTDAVASTATSEAARSEVAKTDLNVPLPKAAPRAAPVAAPTLASVEPTAPAPEVQKIEEPKVQKPKIEAVTPAPEKPLSRRERQKAKVAAVPPAAPVAAGKPAAVEAPVEPSVKPAGESKSLWSAFTSELSSARGTNPAPATARQQTAAAPAADVAPAAPSRKSKKPAKVSEPFNLLTYVKKKITPDAGKPEKKKAPQT